MQTAKISRTEARAFTARANRLRAKLGLPKVAMVRCSAQEQVRSTRLHRGLANP